MPKATLETLGKHAAMQKFLKGAGAVAHRMFAARLHFAKGDAFTLGDENGIIAEALRSARRKLQPAMHFAFKASHFAFLSRMGWHGERQRADEFGGEIRRLAL